MNGKGMETPEPLATEEIRENPRKPKTISHREVLRKSEKALWRVEPKSQLLVFLRVLRVSAVMGLQI